VERLSKDDQISAIGERFGRMTSAVLLEYKGMTVDSDTRLRAELRKVGVEYKVVKNTLVKHAIKDAAYAAQLKKFLVGMLGIAWSYEDPSCAAKVIKAFRKTAAGEKLQIKAALVDGAVISAESVEGQLACLPGKDELRANLLSTLQAPLQQFVALLQAPAQNFVYLLAAKERQELSRD